MAGECHRTLRIQRWKYKKEFRSDIARTYPILDDVVMAIWYQDDALDFTVRLYAEAIGLAFVLMDDSARPHGSVINDEYLESERIVLGVSGILTLH